MIIRMITSKNFFDNELHLQFIKDLDDVSEGKTNDNASEGAADPNLIDILITIGSLPVLNNILKLLIEYIKLKQLKEITLQRENTNEKITISVGNDNRKKIELIKRWWEGSGE